MFSKAKRGYAYPRQFWLLCSGVLINRASNSMIWPFLTIYMVTKLSVPLTTAALLLSLRSLTAIFSTSLQSWLMDRFGRKGVIIASLWGTALVFLGMAQAGALTAWVGLVVAHGLALPALTIGVNAMTADMTPPEQRPAAFALVRTVANGGFAIGPLLGSLLALVDYAWAFYAAATVFGVLGLLMSAFISETRPTAASAPADEVKPRLSWGGYGLILRDRRFVAFCLAFLMMEMGYIQSFSMMAVYANAVHGLPQSQFGWVITTNALLVVLLQTPVTRWTRSFLPYRVLVFGALAMALGLWSVSLGTILPHFMFSMALMTLGELTNSPLGLAIVSEQAPQAMRARYLGLYDLMVQIASGLGPVVGGLLFDHVAPQAMWWGASFLALLGAVGFAMLGAQTSRASVRLGAD
ncbi:MAG: MFS transporter [Anaerolineae bacterium]|nr:MFS transporter [Anaerolineae bacterium]MDW8172323.1 MFS transporter [Anaerolineae bacterium]